MSSAVNVPAPGMGFAEPERSVHSRQPGTHRLIITEPGGINGVVGGDVTGVVFQGDFLSLGKSQLPDFFKKLV